jgi:hypothetical protein
MFETMFIIRVFLILETFRWGSGYAGECANLKK